MNQSTVDECISEVEKMIKGNDSVEALKYLLNSKTGRIKSPFSQDKNHAWYLVGLIHYKRDNFCKALTAFKYSLKHWTEDHQAMSAIAYCYSELGKPRLAERYLRKALYLDPSRNAYLYNLGNALYDQKKYDLAILEYEKVSNADRETYVLSKKNIRHAKVASSKKAMNKQA